MYLVPYCVSAWGAYGFCRVFYASALVGGAGEPFAVGAGGNCMGKRIIVRSFVAVFFGV